MAPSESADVRTSAAVPRQRTRLARLGLLAVACLLLAVAVVTLGGARAITAVAAALPGASPPEDLDFPPMAQRSTVLDAEGSVLAVLSGDERREPVRIDEVADVLRQAVLTAEDRRFEEHRGWDPTGTVRAALANLRAGGVAQGGSSITQQLAKLNFVGAEQTVTRKARELTTAVALEDRYSKDELLERYLNQIYLGSGSYGVGAAAQDYFRVTPAELAPEQAALLAGIIRAPSSLDPRIDPEAAKQRRDAVLAGMAEQGHLAEAEAEALRATPIELAPALSFERDEPFVVELARRELLSDPRFGATSEEREQRLLAGGVEIHTTISPSVQETARQAVADRLQGDGPTAAVASVEPGTGRILALHGGADFEEQSFDLASQGRRQPGSAFKPFVLATALARGMPLSQPLEGNSPAFFPDVDDWDEEGGGVRNFADASVGDVDPRAAMVASINTAFAEMILLTGTQAVVDLTEQLGIATSSAYGPGDGPAIALGGLDIGVTPLEMAGAYAAFAAGGRHAAPYVVERVLDAGGEEILSAAPSPSRVVPEEVNAAVVDILQDVVTAGTGTAAQVPGWDIAGKTGTTQDNADAWFVGTSPVLATAVWVGNAEGRVPMPGVTGGGLPAEIWQAFMATVLDPLDPVPFADAEVDFSQLDGEPMDRPERVVEAGGGETPADEEQPVAPPAAAEEADPEPAPAEPPDEPEPGTGDEAEGEGDEAAPEPADEPAEDPDAGPPPDGSDEASG